MADTIQLEIVTPERLVVSEAAEYIELPGATGYLGVLPGHAPLLTELAVGEVNYKVGPEIKRLVVALGFAEVLPHRVTILARAAERAEEIDVSRAQAAKQRAEEALRGPGGVTNEDAQAALRRAAARLDVAEKSTSSEPRSK
jgi:F-type H+-transporting ATPase subunit epsilon